MEKTATEFAELAELIARALGKADEMSQFQIAAELDHCLTLTIDESDKALRKSDI